MVFGKTKLELKVGLFVVVGLVLLSIFVLSIGRFKTWTSGYRVNFIFNFANGVKVGAPVRYAGVDVGEVKKIKFISHNLAKVDDIVSLQCWIKQNVEIPADSTVWINTLGLLGEKYVEIMPGKDYAKLMQKNEVYAGVDPIPMHEVFRTANNIISTINASIMKVNNKQGTLGKLLYDDSIYNNLDALVLDLRNNPWKLFYKTKEK